METTETRYGFRIYDMSRGGELRAESFGVRGETLADAEAHVRENHLRAYAGLPQAVDIHQNTVTQDADGQRREAWGPVVKRIGA